VHYTKLPILLTLWCFQNDGVPNVSYPELIWLSSIKIISLKYIFILFYHLLLGLINSFLP